MQSFEKMTFPELVYIYSDVLKLCGMETIITVAAASDTSKMDRGVLFDFNENISFLYLTHRFFLPQKKEVQNICTFLNTKKYYSKS